jgi:type I restriction enzyme S subunit
MNESSISLSDLIHRGDVSLGRGEIISTEAISAVPGDYPVYSSSAQGSGEFGRYGKYMFDEELITWSVDGGGRPFYRKKHRFSVTNVCGYLRIRDRKKWNYRYLHAAMELQHARISFDYQMKAHPSVIRKLYWFMPLGITTQCHIAEIIGAIDDAIKQTEALIAKTQQIKAGLMHDLFTRGVTPDGRLRPPRDEAPQLYKESPLGWIPKEWDCRTVFELLARTSCPMRSGPFGSALLKDELVEEGLPFLGIDNVLAERFVPKYCRFVSHHKFVELSRYAVFPRDVIITIMGTVGRCCVVPEDTGSALSSKHLWTMTFDQNKVLPELVCWQLNYAPWVKTWFARQSQGAVMDAIQSSTLRTLTLPVALMDEQERVREKYRAFSAFVSTEQEHLDKLRQLRCGLMHDLLTGRVRVPVTEVQEVVS